MTHVKENAPELLRRALSRALADVAGTGDYRPLERKFGLSRRMLAVCHDLGFPVLAWERSPLVLRDLDLLSANPVPLARTGRQALVGAT